MKVMFDSVEFDLTDADIYTSLMALKMLNDIDEYEKLLKQAPEAIKNKLAN
jgi:ribosome-binding factor A